MKPTILLAILFSLIWMPEHKAQTWEKLPGPSGGWIDHIASNDSVVVASVKDKGFYFSYDEGVNWQQAVFDQQIRNILVEGSLIVVISADSLYYSTDNFQTYHARDIVGAGESYLHDGKIFMSGYFSGNVQSADTGQTWSPLPFGFSKMAIQDSVWYVGYSGLKISRDNGLTWTPDPTFTGILKFITVDSTGVWVGSSNKLYHSSDQGNTWSIAYTAASPLRQLIVIDGVYYLSIQGDLIAVSSDGLTWNILQQSFPTYFHDYTVLRGKIYKATEGIYTSSDGITWMNQTNGIHHMDIDKMDIKDGLLLYQNWAGPIGYSSDLGNSWNMCRFIDSTYNGFQSYEYAEGRFFGVDCHKGIYTSTDTGQTWTRLAIENSFYGNDILYKDSALIVPQWFFSEKVHQTTNLGISWNQTYIGPFSGTGYARFSLTSSEKAILFSRVNVYRSIDNGLSWTNTGLPSSEYNKLSFSGTHFYAVSWGAIYRSNDSAETWINVCPDIWGDYSNLTSRNNEVYVTKGLRNILYSSDNGNNWVQIDSFPHIINELVYEPPFLYVGTEDESIWKLNVGSVSTSVAEKIPSLEMTVFPNPSSGIFSIQLSKDISNYALSIYSVLGNKVLEKKQQTKSFTEVTISHLPKGIYFVEVETENARINKKIVLN